MFSEHDIELNSIGDDSINSPEGIQPILQANERTYCTAITSQVVGSMNYVANGMNNTYHTVGNSIYNFRDDHRETINDLCRLMLNCGIYGAIGTFLAVCGSIILITSFTIVSTVWIYNDTKHIQYVSMYGPNFGGFKTHVSPWILIPYDSLNVTLNGYNSYADVYLSNCHIHISHSGYEAALKDCSNNWEIVKQKSFIYLYSSHFTLRKNSNNHSNVTSNSELNDNDSNQANASVTNQHLQFIEVEANITDLDTRDRFLRGSVGANSYSFLHNKTYTKIVNVLQNSAEEFNVLNSADTANNGDESRFLSQI